MENKPTILYKYLTVIGAEKILGNCTLRFTPPNELNDPFEFMPGGYKDISKKAKSRIIRDLLLHDLEMAKEFALAIGKSIPKNRKERRELILSHNKEVIMHAEAVFSELQKRNWKKFVDESSKIYGITCFSEEYDNILMWSHYANMHKGVVIGFDVSILGSDLKLFRVQYSAQRPLLEISAYASKKEYEEAAIKLMKTKFCGWAYEHEWRCIQKLNNLTKSMDSQISYLYLKQIKRSAIKCVYLGAKISHEDEMKIRKLIQGTNCIKMIFSQNDYSIIPQ